MFLNKTYWRTEGILRVSILQLTVRSLLLSRSVACHWLVKEMNTIQTIREAKKIKTDEFSSLAYRTTVGNNSAENTKIASKEFMTENLPTIAKIIRPTTYPVEQKKGHVLLFTNAIIFLRLHVLSRMKPTRIIIEIEAILYNNFL